MTMNFAQMSVAALLGVTLAACSNHGRHHNLYGALLMYRTPITAEQADDLVDRIIKRVSTATGRVVLLSDSQAETIAIGFSRGQISPSRWEDAAGFAVILVQNGSDRLTAPDQVDNVLSAASVISSAFSDPSTGVDKVPGLLSGTQYAEVVQLTNSSDPVGARKVLNDALRSFFVAALKS